MNSTNIFNKISKESVLKALQRIDEEGYPPNRKSSRYDLVYQETTYPSKYALSLAGHFQDGYFISHKEFQGGMSSAAHRCLEKLGFEVLPKSETGGFKDSRETKNVHLKYYKPFFIKAEFDRLNSYQGIKKDSSQGHQEVYNELCEAYAKLEFLVKQIIEHVGGDSQYKIIKNPINQAGFFDGYLWCKFYPTMDHLKKKHLAITIGLESDFHYCVKIDTVGQDLPFRKDYEQTRGDFYSSPLVNRAENNAFDNWDDLLEWSELKVRELLPEYKKLASKWLNSVSDSNEINEQSMPLNTILYGPPGTGKTFQLNEIKKSFIDETILLHDDNLTLDLAQDNAWWKIIAAVLYKKGAMKVPELVEHPMLHAKHNPDKPTKASHIIWSQLQLHTKIENINVKLNRRQGVLLFDKDANSNWSVDKQIIEEELVDIKELAEEIENVDKQVGKKRRVQRFEFVTFHQSMTYEDFVEGIKPVIDEEEDDEIGEVGYRIEKGIFFECCSRSLQLAGYKSFTECHSDSKELRSENFAKAPGFALFIDEINRGNVSSIFGELITLIEKDKRLGEDQEIWVSLPYSKKLKFGVPPNLHIIGTMNTADRSVEALDTALRRRFSFQELAPDPSLLESHFLLWRLWQKDWDYKWEAEKWKTDEDSLLQLLGGDKKNNTQYIALEEIDKDMGLSKNVFDGVVHFTGLNFRKLLETINERVELLIDKDHMIGHSYFFSIVGASDCELELQSIFYDKIIPLLEEYFYGDFGKIGLVLGKAFVEDITQSNHVVFADFDLEDKEILQDKRSYVITDYRCDDLGSKMTFLEAVKSIYEKKAESTPDETIVST